MFKTSVTVQLSQKDSSLQFFQADVHADVCKSNLVSKEVGYWHRHFWILFRNRRASRLLGIGTTAT